MDRLIPHDEHGPGAIELGVLEFLDRHMQTPYATGDIWYMQGPFVQGGAGVRLPGQAGRCATSSASASRPCGRLLRLANSAAKAFADLDREAAGGNPQVGCEGGKLKFEDISAKLFFTNLLNEVRNGYFADPKHGGNKGMGSLEDDRLSRACAPTIMDWVDRP